MMNLKVAEAKRVELLESIRDLKIETEMTLDQDWLTFLATALGHECPPFFMLYHMDEGLREALSSLVCLSYAIGYKRALDTKKFKEILE